MAQRKKKKKAPASKKTKQRVEKVYDLLRRGTMSKSVIAKHIGVTAETIRNWLKTDEEFKDGYIKASDEFLEESIPVVKKSLLRLATGYTYSNEKLVEKKDKEGKETRYYQKVTCHVPPSIAAIKFILTNGQPDKYEN